MVAPASIVLASLAVAALSLLLGTSVRADPEGWLGWGRALALGDGAFTTLDYPSWKPLPVLLTVPLAFCGALAPALWLVVARGAGILAFALVFDLGRRRAGVPAGVVAAGSLALIPSWWPTLAGGGIEPLLVALGCLAIDRHERGRHGQAVLLLCAMALGREEALPLVVVYGLWVARRDQRLAILALLGAAGVLALWLGGDWLGSGDPLHGGDLAREAPDAIALRLSGAPLTVALPTVASVLAAPLWIAAAVGAVAAVRARDVTLVVAVAAALGWIGTDLAMAAAGFPLPTRFLFPATAALSIAAGVGAAMMLDALAGRRATPLLMPGAGAREGPGP
ncbi:MAG: hypothetical protein QOH30_119 [Baekduia sp.]|nr:hypothetical protein [Baekduia sp.]